MKKIRSGGGRSLLRPSLPRQLGRNKVRSGSSPNHNAYRRRPDRVGAAIVEFAVVAPILFMMTIGMMEVGRMVMVKQLIVNASREAARAAVLPDANRQKIIDETIIALKDASIREAVVDLQPVLLESATAGTKVTVTIKVPPEAVSWVPNSLFDFTAPLDAATTMRKESQ